VEDAAARARYRQTLSAIVSDDASPTGRVVRAELQRGLGELLGSTPVLTNTVRASGTLLVGTPKSSPLVSSLGWATALAGVGPQGYLIRSSRVAGHTVTVIASEGSIGTLYGAFHLLRLIQTRQPVAELDVAEQPRLALRLLNHWDNLDGSIERGYAGRSLWPWAELPDRVDPRIADYGRANASIGINGTVLNSVNANPESLSARYLVKAAAVAGAH
jgi:alpha-glucuronidase